MHDLSLQDFLQLLRVFQWEIQPDGLAEQRNSIKEILKQRVQAYAHETGMQRLLSLQLQQMRLSG